MKIIGVIIAKELKDIFRDKRAVFIALIFPLFLFPVLLFTIGNDDKNNLSMPDRIICSVQDQERQIFSILNSDKKISTTCSGNPLADLEDGNVHIVIRVDKIQSSEDSFNITIICDNTRQSSVSSSAYIFSVIKNYIEKTKINININNNAPFNIQTENLVKDEVGTGKIILSMLLPLLLLVFSSATPLATAADLGAGEKERKTLQGLLTMPVGRKKILVGKYIAITILGFTGLVSFMSGIAIAFKVNPDFFGNQKFVLTMNSSSVLLIIIFGYLLVMLFSALELAVSFFAKTIREAQIIFIPVLIITMAGGYSTVFYDPKDITVSLFNIPVFNISLIIKQLSLDIIIWGNILITFFWTIICILLLFFIAGYIFNREKIIYST